MEMPEPFRTRLEILRDECLFEVEKKSTSVAVRFRHPISGYSTRAVLTADSSDFKINQAKEMLFEEFEIKHGLNDHWNQKYIRSDSDNFGPVI